MKRTTLSLLSRWCGLRPFASVFVVVLSLAGQAVAAPDQASQMIDKLVEEGLAKAGLQPNPPASDEVFLRRIYLDVIGRIPTEEEAREFLDSQAPDKRGQLIDKLLQSEGYVSRWFNFWADILRIKSNLVDTNQPGLGDAYGAWLKEQLRANTPYNKLVYQMLTAQGYIWDNGAVGYYMRDSGMPLDSMANTTQIFLGTRVACAQCHDHPFDQYKQRDFYEMAAYTAGIETRVSARHIIAEATGRKKLTKREAAQLVDPEVADILDDLLEPLSYGIRQDPKKEQRLPYDFRGDPKNPSKRQGMPGEVVKPQPVFSREKIRTGRDILQNYASWMVSEDNPTFTVVIANRLWKSAFGIGLIEPVDDIKKVDLDRHQNDATKLASNPTLMAFLTQHMKACGYDMKKFLRSIYNSRAYQREATTEEVVSIEDYKFPGPVVRRLSAEQLWDSFVGMVIPDPDERKNTNGYIAELAKMKAQADALQDKVKENKGKTLLAYATALAKVEKEINMKQRPFREQLAKAREMGDQDAIVEAQAKIDELEKERFDARKKVVEEHEAKSGKGSGSTAMKSAMVMTPGNSMMMEKKGILDAKPVDDSRWEGYSREWLRAAELPSPAPTGHFLREFGQSERDTIEAASTETTVSQALAMLNGPLFDRLTESNTKLGRIFNAVKTIDEKRDALFLTILARRPTEREKAIVAEHLSKADNPVAGLRTVAWALINTREFTFNH